MFGLIMIFELKKSKQTKKKQEHNDGTEAQNRGSAQVSNWDAIYWKKVVSVLSQQAWKHVTKQMKQMHLEIGFLNHMYIMCTHIH